MASVNLAAALGEIRPQVAAFGRWLLATVGELGLGTLQFVIAIIIAGVFLANAQGSGDAARAIATRLAGERGADYAELGQATVRSVARGILGVALIQSLLAGLGFLAVGVPGAGLLALVCLLLAVVQIGPIVVLIGTVIYVFSTADTFTAVIFLIWSIFVALIDNVLKPILLGRGVKVPMVVIFVGAIGGLLASGIIGLFVGSVVLALSFTLFKAWLMNRRSRARRKASPTLPAFVSLARGPSSTARFLEDAYGISLPGRRHVSCSGRSMDRSRSCFLAALSARAMSAMTPQWRAGLLGRRR